MKFSVRFNNDMPAERFIRMAALAEEAGFDQMWVSHDLFWRSAPVLVAAAATVTSRSSRGPVRQTARISVVSVARAWR